MLPEGGFEGDLTPKTAQKTPRQGSKTTVRNVAFPGLNYGARHRIPTAQSGAVAWPPDCSTVRRYKNQHTPRSCPMMAGFRLTRVVDPGMDRRRRGAAPSEMPA